MDFVRSNFGTNEPLPVEHFFSHFLAGLLWRSQPAKKWGKKVQLAEVHLYRIYFLQNPYFNKCLLLNHISIRYFKYKKNLIWVGLVVLIPNSKSKTAAMIFIFIPILLLISFILSDKSDKIWY